MSVLVEIPQELLRCIVEYLGKSDQYNLFSLCKFWKPLLYRSRTVHINGCTPANGLADSLHRWDLFETSEPYRQKLFHICGLNSDNISISAHRALCLTVSYGEVAKSRVLAQYVSYFDTITVTFEETPWHWFSEHLSSQTIITAPTKESFSCFLKSGWQPADRELILQDMCQIAQRASRRLLQAGKTVATGSESSSFQGVHRLLLRGNGSLFMEMSPISAAKLHSIQLEGYQDMQDVTRLQGIPVVKLIDCRKIWGISSLAHTDTLVLKGLQLTDISILGNVRKLVLNDCEIGTYPVPRMGKGQEWAFYNLDISDVSELANLEKLTLLGCPNVTDISMLGRVKHLTIDDCSGLGHDAQFPTPLRQDQQWTFINMFMSNVTSRKFSGLQSLKLHSCDGGFFSDIATLSYVYPRPMMTFGEEVTLTYLDIQLEQFQPLVLTLSTSARASLQTLCVRDHFGNVICKFVQESLVDTDVLVINSDHTHLLYNKAERPPTIFTNTSLRTAVWLWFEDDMKAIELFGDISSWDVSQVTDMSHLFAGKGEFNDIITAWNVGNVTNMSSMFAGAVSFNQPLDNWNVGNVTDMSCMFSDATLFNQALTSWDVSKVVDMTCMFYGASSFNQPLSSWDMSNVINMSDMLEDSLSSEL